MSPRIHITFDHFSFRRFTIENIIRKCLRTTFIMEHVPVPFEINVLVTNDQGIRKINLATRNLDTATDVLSFPMFLLEAGNPPDDWEAYLDPDTGLCPLGDMCISLERAGAQAKEFGHSLRREVGYLTIHSALHLLGYDHLDEGEEKAKMRKKEEQIAAAVGNMKRMHL